MCFSQLARPSRSPDTPRSTSNPCVQCGNAEHQLLSYLDADGYPEPAPVCGRGDAGVGGGAGQGGAVRTTLQTEGTEERKTASLPVPAPARLLAVGAIELQHGPHNYLTWVQPEKNKVNDIRSGRKDSTRLFDCIIAPLSSAVLSTLPELWRFLSFIPGYLESFQSQFKF